MNLKIDQQLINLIDFLETSQSKDLSIIPWAAPILSFGNISKSKVATLGINPSNREFVGLDNSELRDDNRRFHTLSSLNISRWSEITESQIQLILESCEEYFSRNPYDGWFKKLDFIISGSSLSYYFPSFQACHLDLIPFATDEKWSNLTLLQQSSLLQIFGDILGKLIANSPIEVLILNGQTVVNNFEKISDIQFSKKIQEDWELPRRGTGVTGYSYTGFVSYVGGIDLNKKIKVLGYNHNIQSSYGVSSEILASIRQWISKNINIHSYETS